MTRSAEETDRPIRVLLVEDNPDDVAIIRRMLARYTRVSFQVDAVTSTIDCVERCRDGAFDAVLLDYSLPGEDGIAFLRRFRDTSHAPPVIMLTGQGDERIAAEAMRHGAYDYFPKDAISSEVLGRAVHQALEKFRLEAQLIDDELEGTEQVIFTLAAAAEAKDRTTASHLRRMARYAVNLGRGLGLDERQLLVLKYGGILHDIGKIGISETILAKPGPLAPDEWREMQQHPIIGERIVTPLRLAAEVSPIIRHHHERWDGRGYVDSLSGEGIPLLARVVSIVDAFDSMSSDRPYRRALSADQVRARLAAGAGSHWDPDIMRVFLELIDRNEIEFIPAYDQQSRAA